MPTILGLSCFYHDSAAALVRDGIIVAAAQEERFTRKKHDPAFPSNAIDYCLREAKMDISQIDYVVFYEKPLTKFERLLETYLAYVPKGFASFRMAIPTWIKEKVFLRSMIRKSLGKSCKAPLLFTDHHESHAASAFFPSPYDQAAILTLDGVGEWTTTTIGKGNNNNIEMLKTLSFPHSLGLLYSSFTYYCGFKVNSGEYKLMGLAPYGTPKYRNQILENLIHLHGDGSFQMDMGYFNYCQGLTMTGPRFHALFGGPPRKSESRLEQRHMDLAASIQSVTEEIVLSMARNAKEITGCKNLVLAGGVALNCVANGVLDRSGIFDSIWIQPAAGDAGGALGAALFVWYQLLENQRPSTAQDSMAGSLLGPSFTSEQVGLFLKTRGVSSHYFESSADMVSAVAQDLCDEKIIGWFQGRMEFGPRALGARSILGDPRSSKMQSSMNLRIKFRESFRPFAPIVLAEYAHEWFEMKKGQESPYMLHVAPVHSTHLKSLSDSDQALMESNDDLCKRVNVVRSSIPAVTHVDNSARIQTVDETRNPILHQLLSVFHQKTGVPILVNTSFNIRGEPIVCTPEDAYRCFCGTDIDTLVLGNHIIRKADIPESDRRDTSHYHSQFELD